jgi:hypothetical protein
MSGGKVPECSKKGVYFRKWKAQGLGPLEYSSNKFGKAGIRGDERRQILVVASVEAQFD